jgi:hypothetical protein
MLAPSTQDGRNTHERAAHRGRHLDVKQGGVGTVNVANIAFYIVLALLKCASCAYFLCCQVAAFLVGVMRGKFGEEESQPQPVAGGNGASPRDEHRDLRSSRVQVARR